MLKIKADVCALPFLKLLPLFISYPAQALINYKLLVSISSPIIPMNLSPIIWHLHNWENGTKIN